ncbi:hypothetical protein [Kribbella sp. DT2]|uniref:hypothetical protein n=1 Tax=Kribbella sp. DT2 TaxID=3393427 RepID=UPI003CF7CD24
MNSQHTRTRRGSARALVAVVLMADVFTMHGPTGNHDTAPAVTRQMPSTSAAQPVTTQPTRQATEHLRLLIR